jgi:hypothetical protein
MVTPVKSNRPQTAPFGLEAGQSLTLPVQLTSAAAGDFEGTVFIQSTADSSQEFKFPVTGRVTTPEIALFTASQAGDQEVISGQTNPIDFGPSIQGVPGVHLFSLLNQGSAPVLLQDVSATDGYEVEAGVLPRVVAAGEIFEFQVRLMAIDAKSHAGSVRIDSDDLDESAFEFPVVGEVVLPVFLVESVSDRPALNPQTGLLEQSLRVSNGTAATVPGYQLTVSGLPPGVTVANATGTGEGGTALVLVRQPLGPHGQALLVLEYRVTGGPVEIVSPEISAEVVPVFPDDTVPNLPPYAEVQLISRLADGSILLEILSAPNLQYEVQYSSDGAVWRRSPAPLPATGSRTLWLDRGPPRTDRSPAVDRTRFYRVRVVLP